MKAYKVTAKCGHVGRNYYVRKDFAIMAVDGKAAARITRNMGRVKHHQKDAILDVIEISPIEYHTLLLQNLQDPYLRCTCIQDQRRCEMQEIFPEYRCEDEKTEPSGKLVYSGKKLLRNPRKYMRNFYVTESYAL